MFPNIIPPEEIERCKKACHDFMLDVLSTIDGMNKDVAVVHSYATYEDTGATVKNIAIASYQYRARVHNATVGLDSMWEVKIPIILELDESLIELDVYKYTIKSIIELHTEMTKKTPWLSFITKNILVCQTRVLHGEHNISSEVIAMQDFLIKKTSQG